MKLYIKNMVCDRCIMVIESELKKLGLQVVSVALGEVVLKEDNIDASKNELLKNLRLVGFDLIDDKKSRLIEQIKNVIIDQVHHQTIQSKTNLSEVLASELNYDYNYLSKLFSEVEHTTIEKYFIAQKIEKVKELLAYDELTLSEIAFRLNYSSVAYLSNQFKKVTGYTPGQFKQTKHKSKSRKTIDEV